MIQSRINSALNVVFHEAGGPFSADDVMHALIRTEELGHGRSAVIWDLRKADIESFDLRLLDSLADLLKSGVVVPSAHTRAIVVNDRVTVSKVEAMVKALLVPWPSIVLTDIGEAVSWIGHHHGDTDSGRL